MPTTTEAERTVETNISIPLHSTGPVWRLSARGPDEPHTLDEAIGQSMIERASMLPADQPVRLTIVLPADELSANAKVPAAIRSAIQAEFARRRETAEYDLRRTRRSGWVSLCVGAIVLLSLMLLVEAIREWAPQRRVTTILEEGLMIIAWVALWRPAELLLYDQWPIRRDIALLRRIESADVEVLAAERHVGTPGVNAVAGRRRQNP